MKQLITLAVVLSLTACAKREIAVQRTDNLIAADRTTPPVIVGADNSMATAGGVILHLRDGYTGTVNYKVIYRLTGTAGRWRQTNATATGNRLIVTALSSNIAYEYKVARYVGPVTTTGYSNAITATTN